MKSTLLFICSLLCLAFFSWQLVQTGLPLEPTKDAFEQVKDAKAAEQLLLSQQNFNWGVGMLNLAVAAVAALVALFSLFLLRKPAALHWIRVGLFSANVVIVLSCVTLFGVTLVETMQPMPGASGRCGRGPIHSGNTPSSTCSRPACSLACAAACWAA